MRVRSDPDVAVRCDDVSVAHAPSGMRVVDGVSFVLPHASALAVMGPTGSGKSSLAAILAGHADDALSIVGGKAEVEGVDARRPGRAHRVLTYLTGYLPQSAGANLPARLSVGEVISEPVTSRERRVNATALALRVSALLDELRLPLGTAHKYPYELSAGMRQRVALARALMLRPRLLVADEPYANLDIEVKQAAREAILRRRDEYGMAALVVTNDADTAAGLDAQVLVLRAGHPVGRGAGIRDLQWSPGEDGNRRLVVS